MATIAPYGPNNRQATKLVVAVFSSPKEREPAALQKWKVDSGDARQDPRVLEEVTRFLKQHRVAHTAHVDRIIGCPHEEGIDYPAGESCPECPFWAGRDRFTHQLHTADTQVQRTGKIGRNDPCPCGSGKKYKRCCAP
jgi:hypothetical protein